MSRSDIGIHIEELIIDLERISRDKMPADRLEHALLCVDVVVIGGVLTVIGIPGLVQLNGFDVVVRIRD